MFESTDRINQDTFQIKDKMKNGGRKKKKPQDASKY